MLAVTGPSSCCEAMAELWKRRVWAVETSGAWRERSVLAGTRLVWAARTDREIIEAADEERAVPAECGQQG